MWQVRGLALLDHIGSPQSKEGNDRLGEKIDLILKAVDKNSDTPTRESPEGMRGFPEVLYRAVARP